MWIMDLSTDMSYLQNHTQYKNLDRIVKTVCVCCCCRGSGRYFALDEGHIVGPFNYTRCDTKHRLPCTIIPFY